MCGYAVESAKMASKQNSLIYKSVVLNEKILNSAFDNIIGKGVKRGYINKIDLIRPSLNSAIEPQAPVGMIG